MALDRRVRDLIPVFDSFGLAARTIPEVRARFEAAAEAMPAPEGVDVEARPPAGQEANSPFRIRSASMRLISCGPDRTTDGSGTKSTSSARPS
jgi:hypothetical protein